MAAVEEGQVIGCHTVDVWNQHLNKGNEHKKLVKEKIKFNHFFSFGLINN